MVRRGKVRVQGQAGRGQEGHGQGSRLGRAWSGGAREGSRLYRAWSGGPRLGFKPIQGVVTRGKVRVQGSTGHGQEGQGQGSRLGRAWSGGARQSSRLYRAWSGGARLGFKAIKGVVRRGTVRVHCYTGRGCEGQCQGSRPGRAWSGGARLGVDQEAGEGAVVLAAGINAVPVAQRLQPHLVAGRQLEQHQVGGLVDVLAVQRVARAHPPRAVHHQGGSQRPVPHRDVVAEHVHPSVAAIELAGLQAVVALLVVEDLQIQIQETLFIPHG